MQTENQNRTEGNKKPLVEVKNLQVVFPMQKSLFQKKYLYAVNGVSFDLYENESLAIVGESGSGKSTCARTLCKLNPIHQGNVFFEGQDINQIQGFEEKRKFASQLQMVFQDPFGSLNPVQKIAHHLLRPLKIHFPEMKKKERMQKLYSILEKVGLSPAEETSEKYPHELSGGQKQRVAIARALAVGAKVILADEPVSMLDVSIRLGILNLMEDMKRKEGISFLYITHDIATARYFSERIAVMYVGHMVEWGASDSVIRNPVHPYTKKLISAIPSMENRFQEQQTPKKEKSNIPLWTNDPPPFSTPQTAGNR